MRHSDEWWFNGEINGDEWWFNGEINSGEPTSLRTGKSPSFSSVHHRTSYGPFLHSYVKLPKGREIGGILSHGSTYKIARCFMENPRTNWMFWGVAP